MSCEGCRYARNRWRFLGWRHYCDRYRMFRNERCIDYDAKVGAGGVAPEGHNAPHDGADAALSRTVPHE